MNKVEKNALKIAKLVGWEYKYTDRLTRVDTYSKDEITKTSIELKDKFSSYEGLMPIVFECNRSNINPNVSIHLNDVQVWIMQDDEYLIDPITYRSEESFIEAIQECVIKFLELKND